MLDGGPAVEAPWRALALCGTTAPLRPSTQIPLCTPASWMEHSTEKGCGDWALPDSLGPSGQVPAPPSTQCQHHRDKVQARSVCRGPCGGRLLTTQGLCSLSLRQAKPRLLALTQEGTIFLHNFFWRREILFYSKINRYIMECKVKVLYL